MPPRFGCPKIKDKDSIYGADVRTLTERMLRHALYNDCPPDNNVEKEFRKRNLESEEFKGYMGTLLNIGDSMSAYHKSQYDWY